VSRLITIYSSNTPVDCHILKGRLETEGVPCFIYDEHIVWVHPFRAVAVGGVKLKVPVDQFDYSKKIIDSVQQGKLLDVNGKYDKSIVFDNERKRQNEILEIKCRIRENPLLLDKTEKIKTAWLNQNEIAKLKNEEKEHQDISKRKFVFSWKQFFYELFDFDRSIFKYFRSKPVEYYLEKELTDCYKNQEKKEPKLNCPQCGSANVKYGYAIDYKWDPMYIILSLLIYTPFPLIRKKYHCFNCGFDFKRDQANKNNTL
jgi:DNA-directed RNA polymerase subunit RPC12/RpoP